MKQFLVMYFMLMILTVRDVYAHTSFNMTIYLQMPNTIDFLFITFEVIICISITLLLIKHFVEVKILK